MKCPHFAVLIWCLVRFQCSVGDQLTEKFAWKELEYDWPADAADAAAKRAERNYKPENNLPLSIDVWGSKVFIAVPRLKSGVASSLNYVNLANEKSPKLIPYPDWDTSFIKIDSEKTTTTNQTQSAAAVPLAAITASNASTTAATLLPPISESISVIDPRGRIHSAFQIHIDRVGRLWVLDTGMVNILEAPKKTAEPAIVIFNLTSDAKHPVIRRADFNKNVIRKDSFFSNMVVDVSKDNSNDAYAYIADMSSYGLVVYSFYRNKYWRVGHQFFHFDPMGGNINANKVNMVLNYGIFGLALGKPDSNNHRTVYFHALSSMKEFSVPSYVLKNETRATKSRNSYYDYAYLGSRGSHGQSGVEFFDETTNVLFYTKITKNSLGCWLSNTTYTQNNQGSITWPGSGYPSDVKIQENGNIWVLTNELPKFFTNIPLNADANSINYRVLFGRTNTTIKGTPCEPKPIPAPKKP